MNLPAHPDCKLCPLHEEAHSVGIATLHVSDPWPRSIKWIYSETKSTAVNNRPVALVVIGQNPGPDEDRANLPFVGLSGDLLRDVYLGGIDAYSACSVYFANSARCGPHSITNVGPHNACRPYLTADLLEISAHHPSVTLLFVSAPAVTTFYRHTCNEKVNQKESFGMQGRVVLLPDPAVHPDAVFDLHVFSTFHPAKIAREPRLIHAVRDHLDRLRDHLFNHTPSHPTPTLIPSRGPYD